MALIKNLSFFSFFRTILFLLQAFRVFDSDASVRTFFSLSSKKTRFVWFRGSNLLSFQLVGLTCSSQFDSVRLSCRIFVLNPQTKSFPLSNSICWFEFTGLEPGDKSDVNRERERETIKSDSIKKKRIGFQNGQPSDRAFFFHYGRANLWRSN